MPKSPLEELLGSLAEVMRSLAASEALWLKRMQELRSAQYGRITSVETPHTPSLQPVPVFPSPRVPVAPEPVGFPPNVELARNANADPHAFETARTRAATWPIASGNEVGESAVGRRDYDFFAELDEKLNDLQKRGVGSRGS